MRLLVLSSIPLALTVGCAQPGDASDFEYRSTFNKRTIGLVLHEDGEMGHAGMFGTNCPFETRSGTVTGDYDLPGQDEDIQDAEETELGEITLTAVMPGWVHILDKTGGMYTHVPVESPGITDARLAFDGVVTLDVDCRVTWTDMQAEPTGSRELAHCADIEVDPATGVAAVVSPEGSYITNGPDLIEIDVRADRVSFDRETDTFLMARAGDSALTAVDTNGAVVWTIDAPGPITALDDGGSSASAAIVAELPNGQGAVAFYDALTGEQTRFAETPSPAEDLSVSGDGKVIALVRPEQSFFFQLVE